MSKYINCENDGGDVGIGDFCYVSSWQDVGPNAGQSRQFGGPPRDRGWDCASEPSRKNLSREATLRGWCGTTNDITVYAEGVGIVVGEGHYETGACYLRVRMLAEGSKAEGEALKALHWEE